MLSRLWCLVAVAALAAPTVPVARADVKVHPLFSDNMVLQRDTDLTVWGTADPGEVIEAMITAPPAAKGGNRGVGPVHSELVKQKADQDGKWSYPLPAQKAGTGYTLTVKGNNTVTFKNVAVGDVWLCSGQSNMEWKLNQLNKDDPAKKVTKDQGKEVAAKAANPNIRLFTVPNKPLLDPQATVTVDAKKQEGVWLECGPDTAINFSAVGYFFGRDIEATQKVPVGLISSDWGGTPCEAWTSKEALNAVTELKHYHEKLADTVKNFDKAKAEEKHKADLEKWKEATEKWKEAAEKAKADGKEPPAQPRRPQEPAAFNQNSPSVLYNGMIAPILQFKIKGALWYQGESNGGAQNDYARPKEYYTLFPTMIQDWRKRWGYEFPFFVVQLAPFQAGNSADVNYAVVRDAQFQASKKLKNVGYATLSDIGNETDIHPQAKEPVGKRLALAARAIAYGEKVEWSGPVYKGMKADGNKVVLTFNHVGKGLACTGDKLTGFAVCGEDQKFVPASAEIVGDTVVVTASNVDKPVAVRYGWVNFAKPDLNFANKDGLPAVPFRTDDFPLTTAKK